MIRTIVTIGGKRNIEGVITQEQGRTLQVYQWVKEDSATDTRDSGPRDATLDRYRRYLFCAGGQVESMETVKIGSVLTEKHNPEVEAAERDRSEHDREAEFAELPERNAVAGPSCAIGDYNIGACSNECPVASETSP